VFLLCIVTGATDGWRDTLLVETKFGFGVEEAPRKSPMVIRVKEHAMPSL
jgi:hypothetical protein